MPKLHCYKDNWIAMCGKSIIKNGDYRGWQNAAESDCIECIELTLQREELVSDKWYDTVNKIKKRLEHLTFGKDFKEMLEK